MAKDLDPSNKANQSQRVQAGSMVVKELRSASSGFSLKPELRPSAAAVGAEKNNPKVTGKEPKNLQMLTIKMMHFKTNCAPQRRRIWPKMPQLQPPIHPILFFFKSPRR
jgi:hypothetical protein